MDTIAIRAESDAILAVATALAVHVIVATTSPHQAHATAVFPGAAPARMDSLASHAQAATIRIFSVPALPVSHTARPALTAHNAYPAA